MDRQRLGLVMLAALMLAAGALPWLSGADLAIRLLALPFLLAATFVALTAIRLPAVRAHLRGRRPAQPWPLRDPDAGCGAGCCCSGPTDPSACARVAPTSEPARTPTK